MRRSLEVFTNTLFWFTLLIDKSVEGVRPERHYTAARDPELIQSK